MGQIYQKMNWQAHLCVQPNFESRVEPLDFLKDASTGGGKGFAPVVYGDHVINKVLNNFG